MSPRSLRAAGRWLRLVVRLYPPDFRDEMGEAFVETYRDRCRAAHDRAGGPGVVGVCARALLESLVNGIAERARPAAAWRRSGNWGRDTERAFRRLVRAPMFALTMLATLIVGLGGFATVYTVVHKVLLAPLPYERADDLYYVYRDLSVIVDLKRGALAGTDIALLQSMGGPIESAVGMRSSSPTLTRPDAGASLNPEEVQILHTTANFFDVLGVEPMLGRGFAPEEEGAGRGDVIVLAHELWRARFGSDPGIVGSDIQLNGRPLRVVGVMGADFNFERHGDAGALVADAYVPHSDDLSRADPGTGNAAAFVRVRPGTSREVALDAVAAAGRVMDEKYFGKRGLKLYAVPLVDDLIAPVRQPLLVLGAAGVLLLLVLTVNMATLLLTRASRRDHEFAISRALGASSSALARATLLEAAILGTAGGAGGAVAATWGTAALLALAQEDLPRRANVAVDWQVAAVVTGVGLVLGLLAGAVPAIWAAKAQLATLLRNASVRGGGAHGGMRRAMVVVQVALSLVLLCAGALVVRSFDRLLRSNPGFAAEGVLTMRVPIPEGRYPEDAQARDLQQRLATELAAVAGVESVGATSALPLTDSRNQTMVSIPGAPGNRGGERDAPLVDSIRTRPGYFDTMGIRILDGRGFSNVAPTGSREALIDRTLARQFFPDGTAVGATLRMGDESLHVVGVVEHARMRTLHADGRGQLYLRNDDFTFHTLTFVVRSRRALTTLVPDVRAAVRRVDPQLALADVQSMEDVINETLRQPKLSASLLAGFSLGALLLAAMGLYGVIAGSVTHRQHEMAVRLALGADHGGLLRLVLGEGARLVGLGLAIGVPGVYFAGRLLSGALVGISSFDPATLGAVTLGLALVAAVACYLPARRVTSIAPAHSLREG